MQKRFFRFVCLQQVPTEYHHMNSKLQIYPFVSNVGIIQEYCVDGKG